MYEMWKATIQEMLEEMSPDEVKASLRMYYPEIPELMAIVDELSGRITPGSVRSFCKRAEDEDIENEGVPVYGPGEWLEGDYLEDLDTFEKIPTPFVRKLMYDVDQKLENTSVEELKEEIEVLQQALAGILDRIDKWRRTGQDPLLEEFAREEPDVEYEEETLEEVVELGQSTADAIAQLQELLKMKQSAPTSEDLNEWFKKSGIKGLCKQGQAAEVDRGAPDTGMQSNFSVPNSEGEMGSGTTLPADAPQSGSYMTRLLDRKKLQDDKEDKEKRRKRRKMLLDKLSTKPGDFLTGKKPGTKPAPIVETPTKTTTEVEQKAKEQTNKTQEHLKETSDKAKETAKDVSTATEDTTKAVENLEKAVNDLLG